MDSYRTMWRERGLEMSNNKREIRSVWDIINSPLPDTEKYENMAGEIEETRKFIKGTLEYAVSRLERSEKYEDWTSEDAATDIKLSVTLMKKALKAAESLLSKLDKE